MDHESFWYWLRSPLVEPSGERQKRCGTRSHIWEGFPLTALMHCAICAYRPYAKPKVKSVPKQEYQPYQWKD